MSLNDSMKIVESAIQKLKRVSGEIGDVVNLKIHTVTEKNPGYIDFKTINEVMIGRHPSKNIRTIAFKYYELKICSSYIG